jgi:hypothetical protein
VRRPWLPSTPGLVKISVPSLVLIVTIEVPPWIVIDWVTPSREQLDFVARGLRAATTLAPSGPDGLGSSPSRSRVSRVWPGVGVGGARRAAAAGPSFLPLLSTLTCMGSAPGTSVRMRARGRASDRGGRASEPSDEPAVPGSRDGIGTNVRNQRELGNQREPRESAEAENPEELGETRWELSWAGPHRSRPR